MSYCACTSSPRVHTTGVEDLSLHHVDPGDQTQVRVGGKCLYLLSHLKKSNYGFLRWIAYNPSCPKTPYIVENDPQTLTSLVSASQALGV